MWYGFLTGDDPVGGSLWVSALTTEDGQFRILQTPSSGIPHSSVLFSGQYDSSSGLLSATGAAFADNKSAWLDGSVVSAFTVSGAIAWPVGRNYEGGTLTGTWNTESGNTGGFEFYYSTGYNAPSDLGPLTGVWSALLDPDGSYPAEVDWQWPFLEDLDPAKLATMTVLDDGTFSGTDAYGCEFSGSFGLVDARFSLLSVDNVISGCERAGHYSGLAWFMVYDVGWWAFGYQYTGATITFTADDGEHVQTLEFVQRAAPL